MKALVLDPYLVRDIIPIIVKGLQPILLGQKQDGQVVAGSAGKQEDHCSSQCCCTPHCGPLVRLKNKNKVSLEYCQNTDIPIALYGSILAFLCPASHFFSGYAQHCFHPLYHSSNVGSYSSHNASQCLLHRSVTDIGAGCLWSRFW